MRINKSVQNLFIFAGGLAIGAVSSWFICKKYYQKKADEEIESVERAFCDKLDEINEEKDGALDMAEKALLSANNHYTVAFEEGGRRLVAKEDPGAREIIKNRSTLEGIVKAAQSERIDYTQYSKGDIIPASELEKHEEKSKEEDDEGAYDHPMDDGEEEMDHGIFKIENGRDNLKEPYEIDSDEYSSLPSFEFKEIYYYKGDGVMVESEDDGEGIIDNPEYLVGDVLEKSGFKTNNVKTIYVRNEYISCDFEVIKVEGTYD